MSEDPGGSNSSWWGSGVTGNLSSSVGSLWSKAKETGAYVYEFTANDLNEVATALTQDVIAPSASALRHRLQPHAQYGSLTDTVANMLGNVSEYLAPEPEQVEYLSRYGQDRLTAIQTNQETYTSHVQDGQYKEWSGSFTLEEHTQHISSLLVENQKLRDLHTKLVPTEMSYTTFWKVYYYRTYLFKIEKERHEALLSRVDNEETEEELKWSDDEDEETVVSENEPEKKEEDPIQAQEEEQNTELAIEQLGAPHAEEMRSDLASAGHDVTDTKADASSEGSYEVIKHKDLEPSDEPSSNHGDEDFENELDKMIEQINVDEPKIDDDGDWEDWE